MQPLPFISILSLAAVSDTKAELKELGHRPHDTESFKYLLSSPLPTPNLTQVRDVQLYTTEPTPVILWMIACITVGAHSTSRGLRKSVWDHNHRTLPKPLCDMAPVMTPLSTDTSLGNVDAGYLNTKTFAATTPKAGCLWHCFGQVNKICTYPMTQQFHCWWTTYK